MDTVSSDELSFDKRIEILKYIKHYNGSNKGATLEDFIKSSEYTLGLVTTYPDKKAILAYIMNVALGGIAAQTVRYHRIHSFGCIKKILKQRFQKSVDKRFGDIEQNSNESINDYAYRVESNLYLMIEEERETRPLSSLPSQIEYILRFEAKEFFQDGLNNDTIKRSVKSRNFRTLSESIAGAIRAEELLRMDNESIAIYNKKIKQMKLCTNCNNSGHYTSKCRYKTYNHHY